MDIPKDDGLKWFGEGFDGFPKRLPDDTIEYTIHIIDSRLNDAQVRSRLNAILQTSNTSTTTLLKHYIWQREAFGLSLQRQDSRWVLFGRTSFGDSVADEWLIVYWLRELSKQFPEAWLRIIDTDGEFLLIEAAQTLPRWLNPEIADNRVWINTGQLRIIPMDKSDVSSKNLTLEQALENIKTNPSTLIHSPIIEEEAFYRLQKYPQAVQESIHSALITVPRKLAYILHSNQAYTSPAVEAFYLRDPISLRPLQNSSRKDLNFSPEDFVTILGRFNKASYAQLKSQEFSLPKTWENAPFPPSTDPKDVARREVGMKLSCGCEMLIQDPQNQDKSSVREIKCLLEDLEAGDDALPTDSEIATWPQDEDSEIWMDINFEDFEKELSGGNKDPSSSSKSGFGDTAAQENLRKMVERFEKFLNDDSAGPDGAELDDMDVDDDDDSLISNLDDESDSDEDRAVSFDEDEFKQMMREMMGMPAEALPANKSQTNEAERNAEADAEDDEDEEIRLLSERMEAELNASGALDLNPTPNKLRAIKNRGKSKVEAGSSAKDAEYNQSISGEGEKGDDGEVQINYNLARNLLEAFKGQTGMAGPAGNMMGMMGVQMPRDERQRDEQDRPA